MKEVVIGISIISHNCQFMSIMLVQCLMFLMRHDKRVQVHLNCVLKIKIMLLSGLSRNKYCKMILLLLRS